MTKIGIIGAGTGALPPEVLKMAEEVYVEILNTIAICKDEEDLRNENSKG